MSIDTGIKSYFYFIFTNINVLTIPATYMVIYFSVISCVHIVNDDNDGCMRYMEVKRSPKLSPSSVVFNFTTSLAIFTGFNRFRNLIMQ